MGERVATRDAFFGALGSAAHVELSAYVLNSASRVVRALEACAGRGARVVVRLESAPFTGDARDRGAAERNARVRAELEAHGVDVLPASPGVGVHMKAAVIDGTAYLDDRNWPSGGDDTLIATDDASDVALVEAALGGRPGSGPSLATEKYAALALEAAVVAAGDRIDLESETFGYSAVSKALYDRARAGAHVRVLVTGREYAAGGRTERASLARLAAAGADVRVTSSDEKLCVAGNGGWIGSANATYDPQPTIDWGMATHDSATVAALERAFERTWAAARPVRF